MNQSFQDQIVKFQNIINKVCEAINKQIDEDANSMILQVKDKIQKIAQSYKDEVKINFQEFQVGMKDINIDKLTQLSKKIEKNLTKKINSLKVHVAEFVEFKLDQATEERTTMEKRNRREEIDKITTVIDAKSIFSCPSCFKQYYSLSNLNTHLRLDHNTKFFQNLSCSMCGQLFENPKILTHHLWTQHTTKKTVLQYTCSGCNHYYTEKILLLQHVSDCSEYSTVSDNIQDLRRRNLRDKNKQKCLCCSEPTSV